MSRTIRRLTVAAAAAATAVLFTAVPAAAHVEVESDDAQALAENAELAFTAESESATAGITQIRVVLPESIAPSDVTYGKGPEGWKFTATDDGYTVKGAALKVGADAEYSVVVRQLPDAKELAFKTLQTYGDGKVDRWIELDESGDDDGHGHGEGNPAPVLKLKAAAPGATPVSPSPSASATPTSEEPSTSPTPQAADTEEKDDDGGLSTGVWVAIAVVLVVAVALVVVRRRGGVRQ
ncbi:DUF1775 domain-containing protein [Streptomyces justiciae]|uniref:DUF1775 domain-containing protein n=1 Tax=Streptomyces justiciae TaxID=2780140 RepID=UPI001882E687|nr:DUF1775 domain-containing protein [Streptomyces justiciae]MBE8474997.1 DUF1775 domain-containing protein [Streptomyces justiciae]MCW8381823.1 DUF1775 domain-containing protein [Streptomyces justiciae]